ncbi:hypothetical protein JX266_004735 [Neoarthrinium moseri]|nr:hypothetical protein JX266_004735 [Neoarthrinium moseri]
MSGTSLRHTSRALRALPARFTSRNTSWVAFEQPNASDYAAPQPPKASHTDGRPEIIRNTTGSGATLFTQKTSATVTASTARKSDTGLMAAGVMRIPSQLRTVITARGASQNRPYTRVRGGLWRDEYLPDLFVKLDGHPMTWRLGTYKQLEAIDRQSMVTAGFYQGSTHITKAADAELPESEAAQPESTTPSSHLNHLKTERDRMARLVEHHENEFLDVYSI